MKTRNKNKNVRRSAERKRKVFKPRVKSNYIYFCFFVFGFCCCYVVHREHKHRIGEKQIVNDFWLSRKYWQLFAF